MLNSTDFYALNDPWRPVDARYRRARSLFHDGMRITRRDDQATAEVLRFLRLLSRCHARADFRELREKMPAMASAFDIAQTASPRLRSTLEARLLGGESVEEIGNKMATSQRAIESYRLTFFDLVDRHRSVDFVVEQVIGHPAPDASEAELEAWLKKTVCYFLGPRILEEVFYPPASSAATLSTLMQRILRWKAAIALQVPITTDKLARRELLRTFTRSAKGADEPSAESRSAFEAHIEAMLSEIPWTAGKSAESMLPPDVQAYDGGAAELRAEELLLAGAGEFEKDKLDAIQALAIPTVRSETQSSAPPTTKNGASASTASST